MNDPIPQPKKVSFTSKEVRDAVITSIPIDEIIAEFERRYPTFLLAFHHQPGGPGTRMGVSISQFSRNGLDSEVLGLAAAAVLAVERKLRNDYDATSAATTLPVLKPG
jgi:hypothetical protein